MNESKLVFSVAFAFLDYDISPNVASKDRIATYMRSLCVSVASVRRFYPAQSIRVFTNISIDEQFMSVLTRLNVENIIIPFTHIAPKGMLDRFQSALFLLDAIRNLEFDACHVLLDPDIVLVRELPFEIEKSESVWALPLAYGLDEIVNGMSLRQQINWQASQGVLSPHGIHFGGEFQVIPGSQVTTLAARINEAWQYSLNDFASEKQHLYTEDQYLNYAYNFVEVSDASKIVARIWTAFNFRSIPANFRELNLWHLPAEKDDGFHRLFKLIEQPNSWFWNSTPDSFRLQMAIEMYLSQSNFLFKLKKICRKLPTKYL